MQEPQQEPPKLSPEVSKKARLKVNSALEFLINTNRFYYYVISNVILQQSVKCKTLEVRFSDTKNKKLMIRYNPHFIVGTSFKDQRNGQEYKFEPTDLEISEMFIHEILHICLRHLFNREVYTDAKALAYAQDIVVNDMIYRNDSSYKNRDLKAQLGKNGRVSLQELMVSKHIFDSTKNLNIEDYTFGDLYNLIKEEMDKNPGLKEKLDGMKASGELAQDDHGEDSFEQGDGDQEGEASAGATQSELEAALKALMNKAAAQNFDRGSLPNELKKELNMLDRKPDFKDTLNHFVRNCKTDVQQASWKKPSRRYGAIARGKVSDFKPKILLGIDSSGSVFGHPKALEKISEYFNFAVEYCETIRVVTCDTVIHTDRDFVKGEQLGQIEGGGGTELNPIFERALEGEYDGVVLISDGYVSPLNTRGLPHIALIVPNGQLCPGIDASNTVFFSEND